jgi:hypothetical protein
VAKKRKNEESNSVNRSKRSSLKTLTGWAIALGLPIPKDAWSQMSESQRSALRERMKQAEERDAQEIEKLYSTKPIRFRMASHEYVVPVNYFTPKGRDEPNETAESKGFSFFLFLPDYGGYTKENWREGWFDQRLIEILEIKPIDKNAMIPFSLGGHKKAEPENYGEPKARFQNRKRSLEEKPSFKLYGLEGYRRKGSTPTGTAGITWTGTRSNGEFFFFESSSAPGESLQSGITYPSCRAQYYSEKEALFIAYRYSQNHIEKWREIDDAIWAKLHSWHVK